MKDFVISLVGRPNVGKSTLFNRLCKTRDAIVDPTPNLTRDRRYGKSRLFSTDVTIIDTGGLDHKQDKITELVTKQTKKAIEESDLVLFVVDGTEGLTEQDKIISKELRSLQKNILLLVNKIDNNKARQNTHEFYELGFDKFFLVSAEHGLGLTEVIEEIEKYIGSNKENKVLEHTEETYDQCTSYNEKEDEFIRLAIVGRPNVGKSSLVNRILGEERMVVSDIPGTTRDAIDSIVEIKINDKIHKFILTDTAGIRRKARIEEKYEKISVIKAIEAIKRADISIVLLDAVEGITDQDKKIISTVEENYKAVITVYNKWDLLKDNPELRRQREEELKFEKRFVEYAPHINISALTGYNIKKIFMMSLNLYKQYTMKIQTAKVNTILNRATSSKTHPLAHGHTVKFYYATQKDIKPPTFIVFSNYPEYIQDSYKRYLANFFRENLNLHNVPIRFIWRKRN